MSRSGAGHLAATNGHVDDVPVEEVRRFEADLLRFVENSHPALMQSIREKKAITDDIKKDLTQMIADFKESWSEETAVMRQPGSSSTDGNRAAPAVPETTATVGA